ncbi:MAG: S8 family serine peptidase [Armatimonadetes bacterium]|nr:S8 family serine peptidase [Armatimonadota bacterium]
MLTAMTAAALICSGCADGSFEQGTGTSPAPTAGQVAQQQPAAAEPAAEAESQEVVAEFKSDEVLVKFREGFRTTGGGAEVLGRQTGIHLRVERPLPRVVEGAFVMKVEDGTNALEAAEKLGSQPEVEWAEPNYRWSASEVTPNDAYYGQLWGLKNVGQSIGGITGTVGADTKTSFGWDVTQGSSNVVVAVIDTGVDYQHPDLAPNMWINSDEVAANGLDDDGNGVVDDVHGFNAITGSGNPMDDHYHGTHVAGTIAAVGNNGSGVIGVAPKVRIMACKFLAADGYGYTDDAIECIQYAYSNGAQISNNSWGGGGYSLAMRDAIRQAAGSNHLFVAAAGNANQNTDTYANYPSCYDEPNVLAVGASTNKEAKASFSNYGSNTVDLFAPGYNILSTYPGNQYAYLSGTSMASPHAAGAAALLYSYYPSISYAEARTRLMTSADYKTGFNNKCASDGRLNVRGALLTTATPDFNAPSNLTVSALSSSQIQLTWTDNSSTETSFEIWRRLVSPTTSTSLAKVATTGTNGTSWTDSGLYAGSKYEYKVRAKNASNKYTTYTAVVSTTTQGSHPPAPLAPANLTYTKTLLLSGATKITLTWMDSATDETGVEVHRTTGTTTAKTKLSGANRVTYSYTASKAGSYDFKVRCFNLWDFSGFSNTVTVNVP